MEYKLNLNLQQIAALKAATSFWEEKKIQREITEFLISTKNESPVDIGKEWCKLTKTLLDEWKKDLLPQNSEVELIHIVRMISDTIFIWFQYIKYEYGTEEKLISCIKKIYWTPYGTVDAIKIFKLFWVENPNLDITMMYNFACNYALEDDINDLWNKMSRNDQCSCITMSYMYFNHHIQLYWILRACNDSTKFITEIQEVTNMFYRSIKEFNLLCDLSAPIEENMLRWSVHEGQFVAMKYFWEKLMEEEKNKCVLKCARIAVIRYDYSKTRWLAACQTRSIKRDYTLCQYTELCIFLMNQMTQEDKKAFFNEKITLDPGYYSEFLYKADVKDEILNMLLDTWPWQELFIPVLKDMLTYQDDDSKMPCMFLDAITYKMVEDHELGYSIETSKYRSLLHQSWLMIPKSIKQTIVRDRSGTNFISHLISIGDIDSIKLIFNHPEIEAVREEFIDYGLKSYTELVANNQLEKLEQLMNEIFKSEREKQLFMQEIDPWYDILAKHNFELADKFLDWQSSTPEERQCLKDEIDHYDLCERCIKINDFVLLNKFLDWKFETAVEERKKCEEYFKTDEFVVERIGFMWYFCLRDFDKVKKESTEFLKWVLETDRESIIARYKREKLGNLKINHSNNNNDNNNLYIHRLVQSERFLSWCLSDNNEALITVLKQFIDDACMVFKKFQNGCFLAITNGIKNIKKPHMNNEKNNNF